MSLSSEFDIEFVAVVGAQEDSEIIDAEVIEIEAEFVYIEPVEQHLALTELAVPEDYEVNGALLAKRYAGFVGAEDLNPAEQVAAVASLVPMALDIVDEARDTIQRLYEENERLKRLLTS